MTEQIYKILYIEDNPVDIRFFQEIARELKSIQLDLKVANSLAEARDTIKASKLDLIVSDLGLPDSMGLYTVKQIISEFPELPVIVMTSINDEQLGIQAIRMGAQDYLPKGNFDSGLLSRAIKYSVERNSHVYRMNCLEKDKFITLLENIPLGAAFFYKDLNRVESNSEFNRSADLSDITDIEQDLNPEFTNLLSSALSGQEEQVEAGTMITQKAQFQSPARLIPVKDSKGKACGAICIIDMKKSGKPLIDLNA
ncbi:MAG: response regulator [Desulfonatronovibrio sp. MSAO_Bac4]|nr:MAG: response regulator [Desulfonatronovibrio sp. MSAO_Bac4]